jgi:hypothetical protein
MSAAMVELKAKMIQNEPSITSTEVMSRTTSTLPISSQKFLPSEAATKRKISRFRSRQFVFSDPPSIAELVIPTLFRNTLGGNPFMQFDSEDHRRIFIFTTEENLKV